MGNTYAYNSYCVYYWSVYLSSVLKLCSVYEVHSII